MPDFICFHAHPSHVYVTRKVGRYPPCYHTRVQHMKFHLDRPITDCSKLKMMAREVEAFLDDGLQERRSNWFYVQLSPIVAKPPPCVNRTSCRVGSQERPYIHLLTPAFSTSVSTLPNCRSASATCLLRSSNSTMSKGSTRIVPSTDPAGLTSSQAQRTRSNASSLRPLKMTPVVSPAAAEIASCSPKPDDAPVIQITLPVKYDLTVLLL